MMKEWPGGSYLVIKITPKVPGGRPLMAIGYKCNSRKVLGYIATKGGVVLNQVIPIHLISLKFIIMFLLSLLFVLT